MTEDFEFREDDPEPTIDDVERLLEVDMKGLDDELDILYDRVARNYEEYLKAEGDEYQRYFEVRAVEEYLSFAHAYQLEKGSDL
jgi:hypothetical protein